MTNCGFFDATARLSIGFMTLLGGECTGGRNAFGRMLNTLTTRFQVTKGIVVILPNKNSK